MSGAEQAVVVGAARNLEPQSGLQTRYRILREATSLFAERGFQAATIRDIAQNAGVNLAAVNYHFRSKDALYAAVMETALAEWTSEVVATDNLPPFASLEQVVHTIISALISPVIERDGNRYLLRLLAWGMLQAPDAKSTGPTQSFPLVVSRLINPFLPDDFKAKDRLILSQWLVGQCLLVSPILAPGTDVPPGHDASLIERITDLALGGINAFRGPAESTQS